MEVTHTNIKQLERREFLNSLSAITLSLVSFSNSSLVAQEPQPEKDQLVFRDLKKAYEIWQKEQPQVSKFPVFEKFEEAISICRQAVCSIYIINNNQIQAIHSGFLVEIPDQNKTNSSNNKRYVVTCDHARVGEHHGYSIIVFPNGLNVTPFRQIVEEYGTNNFPKKDLRIFECNNTGKLNAIKGIPIQLLSEVLPINLPALTYQPLNLKKQATYSSSTKEISPISGINDEQIREKFILTRIIDPIGYDKNHSGNKRPDTYYPLNSGYLTAGQLNVGGSGSPNIIFDGDKFYLGGYQVSFVPEEENYESYDGEIRNDARIIHVNNVLSLLKTQGLFK